MTHYLIHKDPLPACVLPRATAMHPDERYMRFGPIQPMRYPRRSLWQWCRGLVG